MSVESPLEAVVKSMDKPSIGKGPGSGNPGGGKASGGLSDEELLAECRVDTFRAGGKGGQHQNKTESGVRLTHGPTGIVVTARDSRSQSRNREAALSRLRRRIEDREKIPKARRSTGVPLKEKRKRVDDKKKRSKLKKLRKPPEPDS